MMGWTLFYFEKTDSLIAYVKVMFGGVTGDSLSLTTTIENNLYWLIAAIVFTLPVLRVVKYLAYKAQRRFAPLVYVNETVSSVCSLAVFAASAVMLVGNSYNPFLYFRY